MLSPNNLASLRPSIRPPLNSDSLKSLAGKQNPRAAVRFPRNNRQFARLSNVRALKARRLLEEDTMNFKTLAAVAALTVVAAPAFAQSFYVVQDVKTKKCTITETKPTTTETTVVSGDTVYKTRAEAETGMKTVKVCSSN